jgi:hypothetical protein
MISLRQISLHYAKVIQYSGCHLCEECVSILEVVEPDLIDGFPEEFGGSMLGRCEAGIVLEADFVS